LRPPLHFGKFETDRVLSWSKLPQTPFSGNIGYSVAMNADMTNLQSLIALWQDEEKRLRSIIKDPQTSPTIKDQASERLASVLDQIKDLADELDALEQTG
jgi:hypothetical protein